MKRYILALLLLLSLAAACLAWAAGISTSSTVTKSVSLYGWPFTSQSYTVQASQAPCAETTVVYGTPLLYSDGIGNIEWQNLQLFYLLSDSLDLTFAFYANSAGTGSALASQSIQAGTPYEWDSNGGTSSWLCGSNWSALKITASNTNQGQSTSGTATNIHLRCLTN